MSSLNTAITLCFCAPLALAGSDPADTDSKSRLPRGPDYCALGDIVGAKVSMLPSAEAIAEATKEGEVAARPDGKISDLLVDSCNGEVTWAVVKFDDTLGIGGKTVVVPRLLLSWNRTDECFELEQSDDQLKALPTFDVDEARKHGLDASLVPYTAHWPSGVFDHRHSTAPLESDSEESQPGSDDLKRPCPMFLIDERPCTCALPQFVFASDIGSAKVHALDGQFGTVTTNVIDRTNGRLEYLVVTHGGTLGVGGEEFLVPFDALCVHENEKGRAYCSGHTVKDLEAGVRFEKPETGCLDPAAATRAEEFFAKLDDARDRR